MTDATRQRKEAARIITMVWGERYLSDLLSMTIPAMLAPGNIPAFTEHFDCELVVVTERRFFSSFAASPVIANVLKHCDVRLLPVDDLLSPWYGITLTYALVRGFADLGPAMTDTHLVFINADFILADGSYRTLVEKIRGGERLVVSPSYCMVLEETIETLHSRYNSTDCSLSISRREMAALIIAHRHNTVRAKTVNQQMFRIHRYDQFYWYVDDSTLLGRQMPIAVVYMRPERVLTKMPTFWDYGVISEYCPTLKPCVLGNSDDFLMGELRTEGTFRELLHLGWPSVDEIARDLSSFTTHDHRVYGRFPLVLHSADLPPHLKQEQEKLDRFVDDVYQRLDPPVSYLDHTFWASAFPRFVAICEEQAAKLKSSIEAENALKSGSGETANLRKITAFNLRKIALLETCLRDLEMKLSAQDSADSAEMRDIESKLATLDAEYKQSRKPMEQELERWRTVRQESLLRLQEEMAAITRQLADLSANSGDQALPGSAPEPDSLPEAMPASNASESEPIPEAMPALNAPEPQSIQEATPASNTPEPGPIPDVMPTSVVAKPQHGSKVVAPPPSKVSTTRLIILSHIYRFIFGRLVTTTKWHPLHLVLRTTVSAIARNPQARNTLVISSEGPVSSAWTRSIKGAKVTLSPKMILSSLYSNIAGHEGKFDYCVCDLSTRDLHEFRMILDKLRPILTPRAKIVVFYYNYDLRDLDHETFEYTVRLFPLVGMSKISFAGSLPGAYAMRWFQYNLGRHDLTKFAGQMALATVLAICGPLARLAHYVESKRLPQTYPKHCTSMTIEISLNGGHPSD